MSYDTSFDGAPSECNGDSFYPNRPQIRELLTGLGPDSDLGSIIPKVLEILDIVEKR